MSSSKNLRLSDKEALSARASCRQSKPVTLASRKEWTRSLFTKSSCRPRILLYLEILSISYKLFSAN